MGVFRLRLLQKALILALMSYTKKLLLRLPPKRNARLRARQIYKLVGSKLSRKTDRKIDRKIGRKTGKKMSRKIRKI